MKKSEIVVGRFYRARVSGFPVTVRVDSIGTVYPNRHYLKCGTHYHVTNLKTGRQLTFQSAQKFRFETNESGVPV